jgi:hypothetical protein
VRVFIPHAALELSKVVKPRQLLGTTPELTQNMIDIWSLANPIGEVVITELLAKH